ncbi:peptide chain release factor H [Dactylosporangium sp. NPDC051485]|uniref:peptide chain release factor H n=1 Tax=Dactylosporangium sp. NPDC051485 TaxID=3154846 RepID=UPI00343E7BC4
MTYLMVSAGRGPQECAWAVAELAARLEAEAARLGVPAERVAQVPGERPGTYRSLLLRVDEGLAAAWTGTLCWQAPSPYRPGHGRKNWYVVARPCDLDAPRTAFAEADVDIQPCRTGGPGGQHRNKVSTAARATHRPTGHVVVADGERHFGQNRRAALQLLREKVERDDRAAAAALDAARWQIHDDLVRGDPVRVERPLRPSRAAGPASRRPSRRGR